MGRRVPRTVAVLLLAAVPVSATGVRLSAAEEEILVSAAVSLATTARKAAAAFEASHPGCRILLNTASSGVLMRQIEQGAPVDLFLSASSVELDRLERKGLLSEGTRRVFASNRLVVVVPRGTDPPRMVEGLLHPRFGRIAIGNPSTVPAGRYAKQALQTLGIWERVRDRLVLAEHVRQVLDYVARAEVDAGLVYRTDARLLPGRLVEGPTSPERSHATIVYEGAVPLDAPDRSLAREFLAFLLSEEGRAILASNGFLPPPA